MQPGGGRILDKYFLFVVVVYFLNPAWLFATPGTVAHQTPLSVGFPGKSTGVGCHFLLQGLFLTQGSNSHFVHCRQTLYHCVTGEALLPSYVHHSRHFAMNLYCFSDQKWCSHCASSLEVPQKIKNITTIWSSYPIPGYLSKEHKNIHSKDICKTMLS